MTIATSPLPFCPKYEMIDRIIFLLQNGILMNSTITTDHYQLVTDKIIALLENGIVPWRRTWSQYGLARNYATGNIYRGINAVLMNNTEHPIPYFMTFKEVKKQGASIKKGSKAHQVYYFDVLFKDGEGNSIDAQKAQELEKANQEVQTKRFIKYFNIFNVADITDIVFDFPKIQLQPNERIEQCDTILGNMHDQPDYRYEDADRLYYERIADYVNVPPIEQFENAAFYYAGMFHELAHWTGHASRLNRPGITSVAGFGSTPYAEEELIGELAAAYICAIAGIDRPEVTENMTAYLDGWLNVLKGDKRFIFKASAQAQKAADYILEGWLARYE